MLKDPRGKFFPFAIIASGAVGAIVGATSNVAAYYASQKMQGQEVTLGGKWTDSIKNLQACNGNTMISFSKYIVYSPHKLRWEQRKLTRHQ